MLKRLPGIAAPLGALLLLACARAGAQAPAAPLTPPRVSAMFTTWDQYYFYAGFRVDDRDVISTNRTPNSEPQQDDDIEVFFETDDARATVRTPDTYQMAVSAGNGAYFSVGDGTKIPKAEVVYTYKYAAITEGTLNDPGDADVGYSVELAIPWAELGQSGPPADGTTWGFNVISRDRTSLTTPATKFYSLSPLVTTGADVQDPSKWSHITFTLSGQAPSEAADAVVCPHTTLGQYPSITGEVLSGKWPRSSRLAFGTSAVEAPAPTEAEEPNTKRSAFTTLPPTVVTQNPPQNPPLTPAAPATPPPAAPSPAAPTSILLPGGGSIQIIPGGIANPFPPSVPQQVASAGGPFTNPLTPKLPLKEQVAEGDGDDSDIAPPLGPAVPPRFLMARYRLDYNGDGRKAPAQNVWNADGASLLVDQPINGCGPWFSGLRPLWHEQQLAEMRRAGIEVALVQINPEDPLIGRELDALVEALKEMKFAGQDYPLLAEDADGVTSAPADALWQAHVPVEFRADVSAADVAAAAVVSPGGLTDGVLTGRVVGRAFAASWTRALAAKSGDVVVDTWNDFTDGTEVAASRQYGERYVDDTRLQSLAFNGRAQWHAKYLQESVPRTIQTRTLYQVPIRIENAGTLPWRAGEGYSLCARWYTADGHLADDSAPRIPIGQDVLPGQSVTLSVGVAARNGYGGDLDPGDYTLVIDMVQGQGRWFTFAGDDPLEVPVHVVALGDPALLPRATFLGTTTPVSGAAGETLRGEVAFRNDGPLTWPENTGKPGDMLSCEIEAVAPDGTLTVAGELKNVLPSPVSVLPGELVRPIPHLALVDTHGHPLAPGEYRLRWRVLDGHGTPIAGHYDESLDVTPTDPGASFVLSDIPRRMDAGQVATAKLALQNLSGLPWSKNGPKIGYHWYYLDGTEAQWAGGILSPLTQDVPPDQIDGAIVAQVRAPDQPGRYSLVFDVEEPGGAWASLAPTSKGDDLLQTIITVTGKGDVVPVNLSGQFNASTADFDGTGDGFPDASLPPDGTAEILENPLELANELGIAPGPPLYPDGYYSSHADHSLPFLYPAPGPGGNAVACRGQVIGLPGGNYRAVHLLAASTGAQPLPAAFGIGGVTQAVTVAPWTSGPTGTSVAFRSPWEETSHGLVPVPVMLGDYLLTPNPSQHVDSLTLPNAPNIKIVAITLEK